jgi:hypothetical protein
MDADCINTPEAFAAANEKARLKYLRSLTLETAADLALHHPRRKAVARRIAHGFA